MCTGKKSIGELAEKIIENNLNIKYDVNFRIGTFSSQNTEDVLLFRLLRKKWTCAYIIRS